MINFLDPRFCPKVNSTALATDHYEVQNLISLDPSARSRGFLPYPIVKPPVVLDFELICPVNIHYISINATVGSHRSSGIEILGKSGSSEYVTICRAIFDEPGVVFCNSRKYSMSNQPPNVNKRYHVAFFKSKSFRTFLNADAIRVLIFRTNTRNTLPCLNTVQIWGLPARVCSLKTRETIKKLFDRTAPFYPTDEVPYSTNSSDEVIIPEDFKDNLTYEMMTIPMTLPSGKTVDLTTLEKHTESEISLGRKPCDPFTGLKFDKYKKPVLNPGLKTRIDMFLLQNSHKREFFKLYRTVGGNTTVSDSSKRKYDEISGDDDDKAISKAKRSCNFVSFRDEVTVKLCINCKHENKSFYKLPCRHLYCRRCILEACRNLKCECGKRFSTSDVKKCHF